MAFFPKKDADRKDTTWALRIGGNYAKIYRIKCLGHNSVF